MSAIYGYNVYCLRDLIRYPCYCATYSDVEEMIEGDEDNYVVKVRNSSEDDALLDDFEVDLEDLDVDWDTFSVSLEGFLEGVDSE